MGSHLKVPLRTTSITNGLFTPPAAEATLVLRYSKTGTTESTQQRDSAIKSWRVSKYVQVQWGEQGPGIRKQSNATDVYRFVTYLLCRFD